MVMPLYRYGALQYETQRRRGKSSSVPGRVSGRARDESGDDGPAKVGRTTVIYDAFGRLAALHFTHLIAYH